MLYSFINNELHRDYGTQLHPPQGERLRGFGSTIAGMPKC